MPLKLRLSLAAAALIPAAHAMAEQPARATQAAQVPAQLTAEQRTAYREIFAAIRSQDWAGAAARLDAMAPGPLHHFARAELYTAAGSPRVELPQILPLLQTAPGLPQAEQLSRLAVTRGATEVPAIRQAQTLVGLRGQPRRARPRTVRGDPVADAIEPLISPLIVADRPAEAEAILQGRQHELSEDALTAFRQRIAWVYYLTGDNQNARRIGNQARHGPNEHSVHAEWIAALASWRLNDCDDAAEGFGHVAGRSSDIELAAAGHYWAARAEMACGRPQLVQSRLRNAARLGETFYGLLAASALGLRGLAIENANEFTRADWSAISDEPNVRAALAAAEIGEEGHADQLIRHQARIGVAAEYQALIHLAARLNLTGTQMWLAHNAPRGVSVNPLARYPMPDWRPIRGWRVDRSLVYAHALQESNFRPDAISPANARGLLQVRPGTAGDMARARGESVTPAQLNIPSINIEYGQAYMEYLRDLPSNNGLLPRVIASYNAGPNPIAEWNTRWMNQADPLLYIESLPYWETRGYVPIILRNMWVYEQQSGERDSPSREALVQGMWPRYPGLSGPSAIRMTPTTLPQAGTPGFGQR
jgi:soluble lytic murein transglycosylase-like protein